MLLCSAERKHGNAEYGVCEYKNFELGIIAIESYHELNSYNL